MCLKGPTLSILVFLSTINKKPALELFPIVQSEDGASPFNHYTYPIVSKIFVLYCIFYLSHRVQQKNGARCFSCVEVLAYLELQYF